MVAHLSCLAVFAWVDGFVEKVRPVSKKYKARKK